jgi:hypothetical protein
MRHANHVALPIVITEPGKYRTRCGEIVTIETVRQYDASGRYSNQIPDTWDLSGRLYPSTLSDNDIIRKEDT